MKVLLNEDRILKITKDGTDVGDIDKSVPLSFYRWTGTELVNLTELTHIWVEHKNGNFVLHAHKVRDSQLIEMEYKDKKNLYWDDGVIKLRNIKEEREELKRTRYQRKRRVSYPGVKEQLDEIWKYLDTLPKDQLPKDTRAMLRKVKDTKTKFPKDNT